MNHTTVWLILGTATLVSAVAALVAHLAGAGLAYLPAVALGTSGVVLAAAMVRFLPEEAERPIARVRDPRQADESS